MIRVTTYWEEKMFLTCPGSKLSFQFNENYLLIMFGKSFKKLISNSGGKTVYVHCWRDVCVCSGHHCISRAIDKFKLGSKTMQMASTNKHLKVRIYLTRST